MFYFLYWNSANMKIPNNPPMINEGINHNAEIITFTYYVANVIKLTSV